MKLLYASELLTDDTPQGPFQIQVPFLVFKGSALVQMQTLLHMNGVQTVHI